MRAAIRSEDVISQGAVEFRQCQAFCMFGGITVNAEHRLFRIGTQWIIVADQSDAVAAQRDPQTAGEVISVPPLDFQTLFGIRIRGGWIVERVLAYHHGGVEDPGDSGTGQ